MKHSRVRSLAALALVAPLLALAPAAGADPGGPGSSGVEEPSVPFARTADEVRGRGEWTVRAVAPGSWAVAWTAPTVLPMGGDRPQVVHDGQPVDLTTVGEDGRTVEAVVASVREPDPSAYDVVLSGRTLDEGVAAPTADVVQGLAPQGERLAALDPEAPGPYGSVSSDYRLKGVAVPGAREKVEMVGHVVLPQSAGTGPRPLVLFMHGRHSVCYDPQRPDAYSERWPCAGRFKEIPSHLGYDYLQKRLATQGYATVSVRVNGINAQDWRMPDGGADARARIVRAHLDHWLTRAAADQVDMDKVVLVGHSRGGEGVNRASLQIPADAPYRIAGQVLMAPTDFGWQSAPYVPTATFLPSCDGDVYDLQGQRFTDVSRDLFADDTSLKSSVLMVGANHNFFNTEWTPGTAVAPAWDDWGGDADAACGTKDPSRLTAREQRQVSTTFTASAVDLFARGDDQTLGLFDGSAVRPSSIGDAVTRSHALGGGREVLRPGRELGVEPSSTGSASLCTGRASRRTTDCAPLQAVTPHWVSSWERSQVPDQAVQFAWDAVGERADLALSGPVDLSGVSLDLRTVVDQRHAQVRLGVRLRDADGRTVEVTPEAGPVLRRFAGGNVSGKWWAQTVRASYDGPAVDVTRITGVSLVSRNASGRVVVLDASVTPTGPVTVPDKRAARISLGTVVRDEGGPGEHTAEIPVTVQGDLTSDARVRLHLADDRGLRSSTVVVPAGTRSTTVPVTYTGDDRYGVPREWVAAVYAEEGVMTDDYLGRVRVKEDDPAPTVTVRPTKKVYVEGETVRVRVTLSAPVALDTGVSAQFRRTKGRYLRVGDLRRGTVTGKVPARTPLYALDYFMRGEGTIAAGRRTYDVTIPVRADRVREGRETAAMRVWVSYGNKTVKVPVQFWVRDR